MTAHDPGLKRDRAPADATLAGAASADAPAVLFVSPVADVKGGAERVLLDLMASPAITVAGLVVPGEGELAAIARRRGVPVRHLDLGTVAAVRRRPGLADLARAGRNAVQAAAQVAQAARDTGAGVVHTNGLKVHVIGALAARLHGTRVLAHLHDIPYTRLERAIWRAISVAATRTMLVSRPCYPAGGPLPHRVAVVLNGIDPATAPPGAAQPRMLPDRPVLGFVGRFHQFKGLADLLDWFEAAAPRLPSVDLLLRGRADPEGEEYWASLQPAIQRLAATGRLRVEGWRSGTDDPYDGIDVLAVPSAEPDPSPRVIMEAMLRGLPVLARPVGGIPELITSPALGSLAANREEFAAALQHLLQPDRYAAVSAATRAHARTAFSLERFWREAAEQHSLASGRPGRAGPG